jgi:hypothetical protein
MIKDPLTRWPGPFPYDVLAKSGITLSSSLREVLDASFSLMEQGVMTQEERQAWDDLRLLPRRLLADFFLYDFDPAVEIARARRALEEEIEASESGS